MGPAAQNYRANERVTAESHAHHGLSLALPWVLGNSTGHGAGRPVLLGALGHALGLHGWVDLGGLFEECSLLLAISQDSFQNNPTWRRVYPG